MKQLIFFISLVFFTIMYAHGQYSSPKKLITYDSWRSWETLHDQTYEISDDGKFVCYEYGSPLSVASMIIMSLDCKWQQKLSGGRNGLFASNNRKFVCLLPGDTLLILDLLTKKELYTTAVSSFQSFLIRGKTILIYKKNDNLVINDLNYGHIKVYPAVQDYMASSSGTDLVVRLDSKLVWVDVKTYQTIAITEGEKIKGFPDKCGFNPTGDLFVFNVLRNDKLSIMLFDKIKNEKRLLVDENTAGIPKNYSVSDAFNPSFTKNGNCLLFALKPALPNKDKGEIVEKIRIWRYDDKFIPTLYEAYRSRHPVKASIEVRSLNSRVIQLEDADHVVLATGDQYVIRKTRSFEDDNYWNKNQEPDYELVSLVDGASKRIVPDGHRARNIIISPQERFLIWMDSLSGDLFSYEISIQKIRNISKEIKLLKDMVYSDSRNAPAKIFPDFTNWISGDKAFLAHDKYDIWQIDPLGKTKPINLTNAYGRFHGIKFQISFIDQGSIVNIDQPIVMTLWNCKTMEAGFWKGSLKHFSGLSTSNLGPYLYSTGNNEIKKSRNSNTYLVARQSESEARNIFTTKDFKTFTQISHLNPQKDFNWMVSELVTYPMDEGKNGKGVLWMPENFDSTRKYPIIFHYYQERTMDLHMFQSPAEMTNLNIPLYVSNGYVVFVPDILNYEPGRIVENTVNAAESAVRYLSRYEWFDVNKIGLQGHSFGGYETNILVANSNLFTAAQTSSGISNAISGAANLAHNKRDMWSYYERSQFNLGATLWERPDIYVKSSPVLQADQVTTPLLIEHGEADAAVPFSQAIEFFTALRRLGKPVWMISYPDQGHALPAKPTGEDFVIRQQQFFDHFLKGKPMPLWMHRNFHGKYTGYTNGYQLDNLSGQ